MRVWLRAGLLITLVIAFLTWYMLSGTHRRQDAGRRQADMEACEKAMAQAGNVSLNLNTTYGELVRIFGQPHGILGGEDGGNALVLHWWAIPIEIKSTTPLGKAIFMRIFFGKTMDLSPGPMSSGFLPGGYAVTASFVGSKETFPKSLYEQPTSLGVRVPFQGSLQGVRMGDSPESFLATSPKPEDDMGPGKIRKIATRSGNIRTECLAKDGKIFRINAVDTRWKIFLIPKQGRPQGGSSR